MQDKTPDRLIPEQGNDTEQEKQDSSDLLLDSPDKGKESASFQQDAPSDAAADPQNRPSPVADEAATPDAEAENAQPPIPENAPDLSAPLSLEPDAPQSSREAGVEDTLLLPAEEQKTEAEPAVPADERPLDSKIFSGLSWIGPLLLILLAALLFAPLVYNSAVTGLVPRLGATPHLEEALNTTTQGGGVSVWVIPQIAGQPATEVLPMQLWWGAAMQSASSWLAGLVGPAIAGWTGPFVLACLFLIAAMALGWTDSRFSRRAGLAAGLAAFCGPLFAAGAWLSADLLLAPALSTLAAACLLRGLKKKTFSLSMFAGGLFLGFAALSGGLVFAALPIFAALFAIAGTLNFRRLGQWDLVFGLALTALILGGWFTGGLLFAGSSALRAYLGGISLLAGSGCSLPPLPLACLALTLLALLLPWPLLPLCMPARSGKALLAGFSNWKDRGGLTEPLFLTALLLGGLALLLLKTPGHLGLLLALAATLSALVARSLTNLTPAQNRRWGLLCALYLLVMAVGFGWLLLPGGEDFLNARLGIDANISFGLKTWLAPAVGTLIGIVTIWLFGREKSSQGGLLAFTFAMLLIFQAFAWLSLPVLHPYLQNALYGKETGTEPLPSPLAPDTGNVVDDGSGGGLRLPMSLPWVNATEPAQNATTPAQPNILGAPMPRQNATLPATPGAQNATLPGAQQNATTPGAQQNATAPVPDAGGALYGDHFNLNATLQGPPPAPYQPGLNKPQEPPLPILDSPVAPSPQPPAPPAP